MNLIWSALRKKPAPAYTLINEVFPYMPEDHIFLGISEIISHLEVLIRQEKVRMVDPGPPSVFGAV